jgi:DNA-binding transcriptional regulator YhcF (GntR family)
MPFNYAKSPIYPHLGQIKEWSDAGIGSREIAKRLGVNRSTILNAYKKLGLDTSFKNYLTKPIPEEKECKHCHQIKKIEEFATYNLNKYLNSCIECEGIKNRKICNEHYQNNKHKWQEYRKSHKDQINKKCRDRANKDPNFKLRKQFSVNINSCLRKKNLTKKSISCIKFLPYSIGELKFHLESQFEPWMNWGNWGKYNLKDWDDNDSTTWRWNIDHIIPAAQFSYQSVEDEEFQKCWSLSNLRPLSAKINLLEGNRR